MSGKEHAGQPAPKASAYKNVQPQHMYSYPPRPKAPPPTVPQHPVLPEGWKRYIDPSTQVEYYWNEINAESTWEFPSLTAAQWIKEQLQSTDYSGTTSSYGQSYDNSEYYTGSYSARMSASSLHGNPEYAQAGDGLGWHSDRGYYEDQEYSDPYNSHDPNGHGTAVQQSNQYGHDAAATAQPPPLQHYHHTAGGYYHGSSAGSGSHTPTRTKRKSIRRDSLTRGMPSPPPGRKGEEHGVHFPDVVPKKLPPKMMGGDSTASVSVYAVKPKTSAEHFTFEESDLAVPPSRAERSLSTLGRALFADAPQSAQVDIGDYISVMHNDRWRIAQVLDFRDAESMPMVRVEIEGNPKVEEWIEFQSNRLAPFGADGALSPARKHVKILSRRLSLADFVEVRDAYKTKAEKKEAKWRVAQIVALDVDGSVTVQFAETEGGSLARDLKIPQGEQKKRIRPLGEGKSPTSKKDSPLATSPLTLAEVQFRERLAKSGYICERMAADGNCLFRALSHQVYGDADKHLELRNACCDYMLSAGQREHLENFVDGDFEKYVAKMRKPQTWGGNLEIEAMQEMFDRPVDILNAESAANAGTFKKDFTAPNIPETPRSSVGADERVAALKISYHGQSHYNSIVDPKNPPPLLPLESSRFQQRRKRREEKVAAKNKKLSEPKPGTPNSGSEELHLTPQLPALETQSDGATTSSFGPGIDVVKSKETGAGTASTATCPDGHAKQDLPKKKSGFFQMPWSKKKPLKPMASQPVPTSTSEPSSPLDELTLSRGKGGQRKELPALAASTTKGALRTSFSSPNLKTTSGNS